MHLYAHVKGFIFLQYDNINIFLPSEILPSALYHGDYYFNISGCIRPLWAMLQVWWAGLLYSNIGIFLINFLDLSGISRHSYIVTFHKESLNWFSKKVTISRYILISQHKITILWLMIFTITPTLTSTNLQQIWQMLKLRSSSLRTVSLILNSQCYLTNGPFVMRRVEIKVQS